MYFFNLESGSYSHNRECERKLRYLFYLFSTLPSKTLWPLWSLCFCAKKTSDDSLVYFRYVVYVIFYQDENMYNMTSYHLFCAFLLWWLGGDLGAPAINSGWWFLICNHIPSKTQSMRIGTASLQFLQMMAPLGI